MPGRAYLDGEIAVLTAEGILDFEALSRWRRGNPRKVDWPMWCSTYAPRRTRSGPLPLVERKAILEKLIVTAGSGNRCSSGCEDRVAKEVRREKPR